MAKKEEQIQKKEGVIKKDPETPKMPKNKQKELEELDEDIEKLAKAASKTIQENRQEEGQ